MPQKKKPRRRVSKRKATLWFAFQQTGNTWQEYEVHTARPRKIGGDDPYDADKLTSTGKAAYGKRGMLIELCRKDVEKVLGLKLRDEAVEVTLTFGKVVKL